MSWFTAKVLQITKDSKSKTTDEKCMFSTKSTTVTETSYYLVVQIEGHEKPMVLVGNPTWIPELPLVLIGDTITFSRARNVGQYGFAQMSIHFDKRKSAQ